MIPTEHVIGLSVLLFGIGVLGALWRRNVIVIMMSIELMLNAVNLAFVGFNRAHVRAANEAGLALGLELAQPLDGQVFALLVMAVAAAEIAVGLAILISLVRNRDSVNVEDASLLRW
jgi:NADH-quinone oxidoreductase subunit K